MATRRTGARSIVVDGVRYRWRIRHRATYNQSDYGNGTLNLAVQLSDDPGSVLVLATDRPHPVDRDDRPTIAVLPSDVENWIRQALVLGWSPTTPGRTFFASLKETTVRRSQSQWSESEPQEVRELIEDRGDDLKRLLSRISELTDKLAMIEQTGADGYPETCKELNAFRQRYKKLTGLFPMLPPRQP